MADDLLSSDEIEALLNSAGLGTEAGARPVASPIDEQRDGEAESTAAEAERVLEQAEADLRAAVSPVLSGGANAHRHPPAAFNFPGLSPAAGGPGGLILDAIEDVELDLRVELGRADLLIDEVLRLREGSVVPLDKLAGDPVDILVNGRLIARGEVLVLNDNFCVRVADIFNA